MTNLKKSRRKSRRKSRKRSFGGNFSSKEHFKHFLIISILMIARAYLKKNPNSINNDLKNMEYGALNFLTISSLISLIDHFFGAKIRDKIILGYLVINIGLDMSRLI